MAIALSGRIDVQPPSLFRRDAATTLKMLKFILPILFCTLLSACSSHDFSRDPLCASCVEQACAKPEHHEFQTHFMTQSPQMRAQLIAIAEQFDGCFDALQWLPSQANEAYELAADAFYRDDQPMLKHRVLQALDDVLSQNHRAELATSYLMRHADRWKDEPWVKSRLEQLLERSDDAIFPLIVRIASREKLATYRELTPERTPSLMTRWSELPEDTRNELLTTYVRAHWRMQASGSTQLPQYLVLNAQRLPLPPNTPPFKVTIRVDAIKIQNKEAKKAREAFPLQILDKEGIAHQRLNLTPWLSTTDTYRINAAATMYFWHDDAPTSCLSLSDDCSQDPIWTQKVSLDKSYKVFLGLETGAPSRIKNEAINAETTRHLTFELCNTTQCLPLWKNGAKTQERETPLRVVQGEDFYLKTSLEDATRPVAARLMARQDAGKTWREIAATFGYAPTPWTVPMRSEIDIENLCPHIGQCTLEFQIRPSLRMARRDPRFENYWGATLELGKVHLDIQNLKPKQCADF